MSEQSIPIVFDIASSSREEAARYLVRWLKALDLTGDVVYGGAPHRIVESWWLPEADLKHIDGNDNPALALIGEVPQDIVRRLIDILDFFADHGGGAPACDDGADACPFCAAKIVRSAIGPSLGLR